MAFAPDYATSGRFYVYYTADAVPGSTRSAISIVAEYRVIRGSRRRRPGRAGRAPNPAPCDATTTAASFSSGRTATSTSERGTAAAAAIPTTTARTSTPSSASCCGSIPLPGEGARRTRSHRTIRSSVLRAIGRRSGPTACAIRGVSRSTETTGDLDDRRRRTEHVGGDRFRTCCRRPRKGPQLRVGLLGGKTTPSAAGRIAVQARRITRRPSTNTTHGRGCSITGGYVVRDPGASRPRRTVRLRRLLRRRSLVSRPVRRRTLPAMRRPGSRSPP